MQEKEIKKITINDLLKDLSAVGDLLQVAHQKQLDIDELKLNLNSIDGVVPNFQQSNIKNLVLEIKEDLNEQDAEKIKNLLKNLVKSGIKKLVLNVCNKNISTTFFTQAIDNILLNDRNIAFDLSVYIKNTGEFVEFNQDNNKKSKQEALNVDVNGYFPPYIDEIALRDVELQNVNVADIGGDGIGFLRFKNVFSGAKHLETQQDNVIDNEQEQSYEQAQELEYINVPFDENLPDYGNKLLKDGDLITVDNCVSKGYNQKQLKTALNVFDLGTSNLESSNNKIYENKVDALSPDAAKMLFDAYERGIISGGLNFKHLPQGFFIFERRNDNGRGAKQVLDYNVSIAQVDSKLRQNLNPIKSMPNNYFDDIDKVEKFVDLPQQVNQELVNLVNTLFLGIDERDQKIIAKSLAKTGGNIENVLQLLDSVATNVVKNFPQDHRPQQYYNLRDLFLKPIWKNESSSMGYLLEDEPLEIMKRFKDFAGDKNKSKSLPLLFGMMKSSQNDKANPLYQFEAFEQFYDIVSSYGIRPEDFPQNASILGKNDVSTVCYRISKIIETLHKNDVESGKLPLNVWKNKVRRIFQGLTNGTLKLGEAECYHAVCVDGLTDLDTAMYIQASLINQYENKLSYIPNFENDIVKQGDDKYFTIKRNILRFAATKNDGENDLKGANIETLKSYFAEIETLNVDNVVKSNIAKALAQLPVNKYDVGVVKCITDFLKADQNNVTMLKIIVAQLKGIQGANFIDLGSILNYYTVKNPKIRDISNVLDKVKIKAYDWKYFRRIFHNLSANNDVINVNDLLNDIQNLEYLHGKEFVQKAGCVLSFKNIQGYNKLYNNLQNNNEEAINFVNDRFDYINGKKEPLDENDDNLLIWNNILRIYSGKLDYEEDRKKVMQVRKSDFPDNFPFDAFEDKEMNDMYFDMSFVKNFIPEGKNMENSELRRRFETMKDKIRKFADVSCYDDEQNVWRDNGDRLDNLMKFLGEYYQKDEKGARDFISGLASKKITELDVLKFQDSLEMHFDKIFERIQKNIPLTAENSSIILKYIEENDEDGNADDTDSTMSGSGNSGTNLLDILDKVKDMNLRGIFQDEDGILLRSKHILLDNF